MPDRPRRRDGASGRGDIALSDLVSEVLKPYSDAARLTIGRDGPAVRIGPDASAYLALAINELATNAVKYGALSNTDGSLSLSWIVDQDTVILDWSEHRPGGGMAIGSQPGFGSKLIDLCISVRLEGRIETRATDHGLSRAITLPMRALAT
ncbi:hypothetical protein ILP92_17325 [Maribius pontilimi]|uniref:histidine kinase n=1 Tax=Palleronia pontilimi TaxID=1964209 RepID=A0A934IJK9_9RHOB|nr:hypothetical protein [Palleronia pontilimi]MBJ3764500.1 hypothetical protein [Palleronia pontilimi]